MIMDLFKIKDQDLDLLPTNSMLCIVGARPNFIKIAPIIREFESNKITLPFVLLHTGQHYDVKMKDTFFEQLDIPEPDIDLNVGSGTHATQTAHIMIRFEMIVDVIKPRALLVVGDVNSTLACSLVASKKNIPIFHIEAGLRSRDRSMPEEINRIITDQLSELLFITELSAKQNLVNEGIDERRIHFVGNVMIDTLYRNLEKVKSPSYTLSRFINAEEKKNLLRYYGLVTLHRPSNVDNPIILGNIIDTLIECSRYYHLIFVVHPRTEKVLNRCHLIDKLKNNKKIILLPPQGYLEMLGLMKNAKVVLTDSGGMQEETTALGIPCVTLRENTERPVTLDEGTNILVGTNMDMVIETIGNISRTGGKCGRIPDLWDGRAADRIVKIINHWALQNVPA